MSQPLEASFIHRVPEMDGLELLTPVAEEDRPALTIAICTQDQHTPSILRALGDVLRRGVECRAEVLLVAPALAQEGVAASLEFTPARLLPSPADATRRELRACAMREASGDIVIFLDDLTSTNDGWRARLDALLVEQGTAAFDLSVVVPAHNAEALLPVSLAAVEMNTLDRRRWELIVIDDASSDGTALRAAEFADKIVRLPGQRAFATAYARNRGAEVARGASIVFLDSDVRVYPQTLEQFLRVFDTQPDTAAVIGSYDTALQSNGLVSGYRNLLHHFYHHRSGNEAQVFWAGCGAIRASAFRYAGMFDEWSFPRPQLEDIDLGARLLALGYRITRRAEIEATHLKAWTLLQLLRTELLDQGLPWMRVVSQRTATARVGGATVRSIEYANTALTWGAFVSAIVSALSRSPLWAGIAGVLLCGILINTRDQLRFFAAVRGVRFALETIPIDLLCYLVNGVATLTGAGLHQLLGEPRPDPVTEAMAEVGAKQWPPIRSRPGSFDRTIIANELRHQVAHAP